MKSAVLSGRGQITSGCQRFFRRFSLYHALVDWIPSSYLAWFRPCGKWQTWVFLLGACALWMGGLVWWGTEGYWQYHEGISAISSVWQGGAERAAYCGRWAHPDAAGANPAEVALAAEVARKRGGPRGTAGDKPRIAILSLYDEGWGWAGSIVDSNRIAYCQRWGCEYVNANALINASRPTAWSKLTAMAHHLPHYDWLLYLDADALIMNPAVPIAAYLDRRYDFIATNDGNGFNSGAMLVQNTPWSQQWLRQLWAQEHLVTGKNLPFLYEQRAFHALLSADPSIEVKHVKYLPPCAFNSQLKKSPADKGQYVRGDFVLHFAGYHGVTKGAMLCRYAAALHREWVPLQDQQINNIPPAVARHCSSAFGVDAHLLPAAASSSEAES